MINWLKARRGFITGSTGWIGTWICQYLTDIEADFVELRQRIHCFDFPKDIDYIIHLVPTTYTDRIIKCAQEFYVPFLFTSSGSVNYEDMGAYGKMKLENELKFKESGIDVKIARCYAFAGAGIPLDQGYALGNFIYSCLNDKDIIIRGTGQPVRTYMYMSDLVEWLFKILIDGKSGKPYDVGGETWITIHALARKVRRLFNSRSPIIIENRHERLPFYVPDLLNAKELGCEIKVGLDEAIRMTVEYYKEEL